MTLRELIISVDSEQYSDSPLYQKLREIKPEYGSSRHIQVKFIDGKIAVTNAHVGSMGDILTYPIDVEPDLNISKVQLLDAILHELSSNGFSESEESDFWSDFDNLQKKSKDSSMTDFDSIWRTQDEIRTVVNAVLGECIWNLAYDERRSAIVLELTFFLDEDAISNLCCQFPIPADYDGVGSKGTKFVFYL